MITGLEAMVVNPEQKLQAFMKAKNRKEKMCKSCGVALDRGKKCLNQVCKRRRKKNG